METENTRKPETFFDGSIEKWLSVIPENSVNEIIRIMNVDLDALDKYVLWKELSAVIRGDVPSASTLGMNLKLLRDESKNMENTLSKAIEVLEGLQYNQIYAKGTMTKEFEIARKIRQKSKVKESTKNRNVSDLYIKQEYDKSGLWGKYCILDYELPGTITKLKKIHNYIQGAKEDFSADIRGRGEQNTVNTRQANLIFEICKIYKKYTGMVPNFSTSGARDKNSHKVYGNIIRILQIVLSFTYFRESSDGALEKRLRELRKRPEYKYLWENK